MSYLLPVSRGRRIVAYVNYTLVSIVLFLGAWMAFEVALPFATGRVAEILRSYR